MTVRRPALLLVALAVPTLVAAGCSAAEDRGDGRAVLATTTIWADVVERVACRELDVPALVPPGVDAHSYEPTVHDADRLHSAALVVANGVGLEDGLQDALATARDDGVAVLDAADHVDVIGGDPHLWMDPGRVADALPALADALVDAGAGPGEARIRRCARGYADELAEVAGEIEALVAALPADRRAVVTNHETLGYFADRFGLEVLGAVVPATSSLAATGPRHLDELEDEMRERGVDVVVAEVGADVRDARVLAERVEGTLVRVHTESLAAEGEPSSYVQLLRTDARRITGALGGGAG